MCCPDLHFLAKIIDVNLLIVDKQDRSVCCLPYFSFLGHILNNSNYYLSSLGFTKAILIRLTILTKNSSASLKNLDNW